MNTAEININYIMTRTIAWVVAEWDWLVVITALVVLVVVAAVV